MAGLMDYFQPITDALTLVNPIIIKIVIAVIILLIGFIIGRILGKIILKILDIIDFDKTVNKIFGLKIPAEKIISGIVSYFIYFFAIVLALNKLGLTTALITLLSVILIVVLLVAFFLGLKDIIPNFFAGFIVRNKVHLKPGDNVKVKNTRGKITRISLLEIQIETKHKDIIIIPNSVLLKEKVVKLRK